MSAGARRALRLALALLLGAGAVVAVWRAGRPVPVAASEGAFEGERSARARALLGSLLDGLVRLQQTDGGFAPWAEEDRPSLPEPEVKRTASSALAAWALVEGVRALGRDDLSGPRDKALAYLLGRMESDGTLGRLPPNPLGAVGDPGPEVTALSAGLLAFARSGEERFALALGQGTRALAARIRVGPRDGWQRALVAMAVDGVVAVGRGEGIGREPRRALPLGQGTSEPDCGDYRLAEAIVRVVREEPATGDLFPEAVVKACIEKEPPVWSGATTDLPAWLLQAWLAARTHQGRAWFAAALSAVGDAQGEGGWVPGGIYADRVAQSASAALVIALGLSS